PELVQALLRQLRVELLDVLLQHRAFQPQAKLADAARQQLSRLRRRVLERHDHLHHWRTLTLPASRWRGRSGDFVASTRVELAPPWTPQKRSRATLLIGLKHAYGCFRALARPCETRGHAAAPGGRHVRAVPRTLFEKARAAVQG